MTSIPIGISSCLLGEPVRYDGGHKSNSYVRHTLGEYFSFEPFCPELSIGLGVPRKPIRLAWTDDRKIECTSIEGDINVTEELKASALGRRDQLATLCGYILKRGSPSCGMERVKVWGPKMPTHDGVGIYARTLMEEFPYLPVEEEGRLGDAVIRENFVQRVYVLHRWKTMEAKGIRLRDLIEFHATHKLIIMSHNQNSYRELGRLIAGTNKETLSENASSYLLGLMAALKIKATRGNHVNVLQHIQGYLRPNLDAADRAELKETIENYHSGHLPLIVPITLLNHFFRKFPDEYISKSWYMHPYPGEMSLQNAI